MKRKVHPSAIFFTKCLLLTFNFYRFSTYLPYFKANFNLRRSPATLLTAYLFSRSYTWVCKTHGDFRCQCDRKKFGSRAHQLHSVQVFHFAHQFKPRRIRIWCCCERKTTPVQVKCLYWIWRENSADDRISLAIWHACLRATLHASYPVKSAFRNVILMFARIRSKYP